jgi:hypothetical protein
VSKSLSVKFIVRSTLLCSVAVVSIAACADAPNAPSAAERRGMTPSLAKANPWGPYTAVFDDGASNKLGSDGQGTYIDSEAACVNSETIGGGLYQLRTIRNTIACKRLHRGEWRYFTIDLGAPIVGLDLDQDGGDEATEAAPARLLADNAFAQGASSTPLKIFVLQVLLGDSTSQNHKYQILYRTNVRVSGSGTANSPRVLEASAVLGNAKVDIYDAAGAVVASNVDLPFKLTLTKQ